MHKKNYYDYGQDTKTSKAIYLFLVFNFQGDGGAHEQYWKFTIKALRLPLPTTRVISLGFLGSGVMDIAAFSFGKEATLITAKEDDFIYFCSV